MRFKYYHNIILLRSALFLLVIIICITGFSQNTPNGVRGVIEEPGTTKPIGNQYALVVGVSHYHNIAMLHYAVADARSFKDFLVDTKLVSEANVHFLFDSTATRSRFYAEIKKISDKLKENDRVIIYFAGHGDVDNDIDAGFLLGYDCEATPYAGSDAIDIAMLERYVDAITKKNVKVILISDACRSGKLTGGTHGAELTLNALSTRFKNTVKFLSCGPGELSEEKDFRDGGHGIFTYYLLQALYGLADNDNDNILTQKEIDRYLRDNVDKATAGRQNPKSEGNANEAILQVVPELKQAWLAKVKNVNNDKAVVATRTVSEKKAFNLSPEDSLLVKKFYDQLRTGKLNIPKGDNAYETFLVAKKNITNAEVINSMKYDLTAEIQDDVQPLLNRVTRGEFQDTPYELYESAGKKLEVVRTALITPDDYQYNDIKALQIYFKRAGYHNDEALKDLLLADSLHPNTPYISCEIAYCYTKKLDPDTANGFKYLRKAMVLSPKWAYPYLVEGLTYLNLNMLEKAKTSFEKAIQIKNDYKLAFIDLGVVYNRYKDYNKEIGYYYTALKIEKPDMPVLFSNIGLYWLNKEKYDSALYYYRKSYSVDTFNIFNLSIMVKCLVKINQKDSALYYLEKLNHTNPGSYDDYKETGNAYYQVGDYTNALKNYMLSINDRKNAEGYNYIGLTYEKLNQLENAKFYYKEALSISPNYYYSLNNLISLYSTQGNSDSANYYRKRLSIRNLEVTPSITELISFFANANQMDSAFFYLEKLKNLASSDPKSALNVADAYFFDIKNYDQAINFYIKAAALKPDARTYNNIGAAYEGLKNSKEAINYYRKAFATDPAYTLAIKNIAELFEKENQLDSSKFYLEKLVSINPSDPDVLIKVADAYYFNFKDYNKALLYYNKALPLSSDPRVSNNLGAAYEHLNKPEEAIKFYKKAIELDPQYTLSLSNLVIFYEKTGNNDSVTFYKKKRGTIELEKLKKTNSSDAETLLKMADLYFFDLKDYEQATNYYIKSVAVKPDKRAYNNIGAAYEYFDKTDEAMKYYKKAVETDPKYTFSMNNIGLLLTKQKQYDSSNIYYRMILNIDPKDSSAISAIANNFYALGNYDSALVYYKRTLTTATTPTWLMYNNIGACYIYLKAYDAAIVSYKKAVELNPKNANNYVNIGHSYYYDGKYTESIPYYEKTLTLDSTYYIVAYSNLGYDYMQLKRYEDAIVMYQKALKLDKVVDNHSTYYYNIACARSIQSKKEEALNYFDKALKAGYLDLKHFEEDTDLDNIRMLPEFKKTIEANFKKEEIDKYPKLFASKN